MKARQYLVKVSTNSGTFETLVYGNNIDEAKKNASGIFPKPKYSVNVQTQFIETDWSQE